MSDCPAVQAAMTPNVAACASLCSALCTEHIGVGVVGVTMVGCDQTCAYYEISLETPHGQLFATVAMPRVFLANRLLSPRECRHCRTPCTSLIWRMYLTRRLLSCRCKHLAARFPAPLPSSLIFTHIKEKSFLLFACPLLPHFRSIHDV